MEKTRDIKGWGFVSIVGILNMLCVHPGMNKWGEGEGGGVKV